MRCFFAPISASYAAAGVLLRLIRERTIMKTTRKEAEQTPRRLILPKEFSKECYLVDFEKEYGKDNGIPERWGIATELTSDGLERKYGAFLNPYRPFRIMRWEEGAVIAAFIRNDEKHRKWQIRHDDGLGYSDRTDIKKYASRSSLQQNHSDTSTAHAVKRGIMALGKRHRRYMLLYYFKNLPIAVIAEMNGVTKQYVSKVICEGRGALKETLPPECSVGRSMKAKQSRYNAGTAPAAEGWC